MLELQEMNMDQELRDSKLWRPLWAIKYGGDKYMGGIMHFDNMDYDTLQWMVDNRFADPEERQNDGPTINRFLHYLKEHPNFRATGYVVDKGRSDYRLSVDAITATNLSDDDMQFFMEVFARWSDEFEVSPEYARAWWD